MLVLDTESHCQISASANLCWRWNHPLGISERHQRYIYGAHGESRTFPVI